MLTLLRVKRANYTASGRACLSISPTHTAAGIQQVGAGLVSFMSICNDSCQ